MKIFTTCTVLLAALLLCLPDDVFGRGFGSRGDPNADRDKKPGTGGPGAGAGGGDKRPGGGGPGAGLGAGPGAAARFNPGAGGGLQGKPGGGPGPRANPGGISNHSPSFSHPVGNGSAKP